ncbi:hypothetical protein TNCT_637731 [Trichonephila clavata]|uniref:Uncharacterized protein n=1 Tax=Trichonephila clavata TaxID=2740835 RepID=A0A8X6GU19_TRICU|nr:hypothetical protein TNCT_637731 [Trichonephila clavata]
MRQLTAVTPDNSNRNAVESGSSRRWNNQAYGDCVNTGTAPLRFQSGGYGQPHQSHMDIFVPLVLHSGYTLSQQSHVIMMLNNFLEAKYAKVTRTMKDGIKEEFDCPVAIEFYNKIMVGADLVDQMANVYGLD